MKVASIVGRKVEHQAPVVLVNRLGRALLQIDSHNRRVDPEVGASKRIVVLLKAGDEGKISRGGKARLGTDTRGRKHWVTDKQQPAGDRHPAAANAGAGLEGARKAFSRMGVEVTEETAEKSGNTYIGFAGNTYAQLAMFGKLKDQGLCWGFRKSGKFVWACKPENLQRVTEAFHGPAQQADQQPAAADDAGTEKTPQPAERTAEAGSGSAEPRPDRGGDDRGGAEPERGGDERVPEGAKAGGERGDSDDRRASEDGAGAERDAGEERVADKPKPQPELAAELHGKLGLSEAMRAQMQRAFQYRVRFVPDEDSKTLAVLVDDPSRRKEFLDGDDAIGRGLVAEARKLGLEGTFHVDPARGERDGVVIRLSSTKPKAATQASSTEAAGVRSVEELEADRPKDFGKYGQEGGVKHWEVREDDYIENAHQQHKQRTAKNLEAWQKVAADPKQRPAQRSKAAYQVKLWEQIHAGVTEKPTEGQRETHREAYAKLVKQALSKGMPVPQAVIDQRPEFKKARTARARYEKGRHTSFGNESVAVSRAIVDSHGVKVKHQDGSEISPEHVREIGDGIREVEKALGPLGDILRAAGLTIAHTSGKHPFLSHFGGLFVPGQKSISMGTVTKRGKPIKVLAHELAHFLDFEAGAKAGHENPLWDNAGRRRGASSSMALHESRKFESELLRKATSKISNTTEIRRKLKATMKDQESAEAKEEVEVVKVRLGPYWRDPQEVFARLVEQYVSTVQGGGIAADEDYTRQAGWWTADDFAELAPMVRDAIAKRLEILGGDSSKIAQPKAMLKAVVATGRRVGHWFRSLLGRREDILELTDVVEEPRPPCCAPEPRVVVLMRTA